MPALNFQKQFMAAVRDGTKRQTIRAARKRPIKVGDMLHLFTGMRTKNCLRLRVTHCTEVSSIVINKNAALLGGRLLSLQATEDLAIADGFSSGSEFVRFFRETHGLPFVGQLIKWKA